MKKRLKIISEVNSVIPDVESAGVFPPIVKRANEHGFFAVAFCRELAKRSVKAARDRAKANDHVVTCHRVLWRGQGILISEGVQQYVGVIVFYRVGNSVDKVDDRSRGATFEFFKSHAVFASAASFVIILCD